MNPQPTRAQRLAEIEEGFDFAASLNARRNREQAELTALKAENARLRSALNAIASTFGRRGEEYHPQLQS